jgi:hypothetical protein
MRITPEAIGQCQSIVLDSHGRKAPGNWPGQRDANHDGRRERKTGCEVSSQRGDGVGAV